ncbi:hypothetical protein [Rugamonas sp. DEMB1]|uniref:hypothetical protein n=1 Tax=Rugamonas sp. DEMB1 TaxID=3039386 RepID=UPI0024475F87|nr:hypothetical protein [Rugamonas sp. DEMB1]WGG52572.1 hypothetical protein QC826_10735 [Rugamonas sp. DEMB1]
MAVGVFGEEDQAEDFGVWLAGDVNVPVLPPYLEEALQPFLICWFKDKTGSTDLALYILSAVLFLGAVLVMRVPGKVVNR